MSKMKTKVIDGLPMNFESTDPKDFVEVLNRIAEAMGGVPNMGVFADITSVAQSNEMIASVADKYVSVSTKHYEKPYRDLTVTTNVADPYQFELDTLVGKNGSNIPADLEHFLASVDKPKETPKKVDFASTSPEKPKESFGVDNHNETDDFEEDDEDENEEGNEDVSISGAFREVGKEFSSAFKETAGAFKDAFKFK